MKKKLAALAVLLGSVLAFAACSSKVTVTLNRNWNLNTSAPYDESFYEQLVYDVRYAESESSSTNGLKYTGVSGSYTATTEAEQYFRQSDNLTVTQAYKHTTVLEVSATVADENGEKVYAFGGDTGIPADRMETTVYFRDTSDGLAPLESTSTVYTHTPMQSGIIVIYKYTTSIVYSADGKKATSVLTDKSAEITEIAENTDQLTKGVIADSSTTLSSLTKSYSCFDNAQLLFAARGLTFSDGSSDKVTVVSTAGGKQTVTIACDEIVNSEYSFTLDGEQIKESVSACTVNFSVSGTNTGVTHTVYYANKGTNASSNRFRNMPLRIESPLAYGMGTFHYVLTSASHTAPAQG